MSPPPPYPNEPSICTKQLLYAPRALSALGKCYTQCEKDITTVRPASETGLQLQNCQKIAGIPFSVPARDDAEAYAYMSTAVDADGTPVVINNEPRATCVTAEGIHQSDTSKIRDYTDASRNWKTAIEKLWVAGPCCDRRSGSPIWVPPVMWGQVGSINNDDWDYCGTRFNTEGTCVRARAHVCVCVCVLLLLLFRV